MYGNIDGYSFYVMALHFIGFKLCTLALQGIGYGGQIFVI